MIRNPLTNSFLLINWLGFGNEKNNKEHNFAINDGFSDWKKIYEVLQYTGLKDKNGKEIYEGDIVKSRMFSGGHLINQIIYNSKECAFTIGEGTFFGRYKNEIIGNIYENPDLLK